MKHRRILLPLSAILAFLGADAGAETITAAHYANPVERYSHFALGRPHEYARLTATTDTGRKVVLELPEDEVFEDLTPRLISLATGEPKEILSIVSQRNRGSRLVLIGLNGDRLSITAESPAIGTPQRWMNPVGIADMDGDGRAEIAAVTTPHIGGNLRVYRRNLKQLIEVGTLSGFSNHVYRSTELGLSTAFPIGGRMHLLVPDDSRQRLRLIAWERGSLHEAGQCTMPAPITGPIKAVSATGIVIGLASGERQIVPGDCLANRSREK